MFLCIKIHDKIMNMEEYNECLFLIKNMKKELDDVLNEVITENHRDKIQNVQNMRYSLEGVLHRVETT